jgi:hypothetical protein
MFQPIVPDLMSPVVAVPAIHQMLSIVGSVPVRLADVTLDPNPSNLPGGSALQQLTNGLGGWALIFSLIGLLIGAASWALGSHTQNYQQSFFGRRAVLVSGLAALLIGAAPALINFFFHTGLSVH